MRGFQAGDSGELSGIKWRIVEGRKGPGDLRLEMKTEGWVPPSMALGGLQVSVYYENEERLYPPPFKGGRKYLEYLKRCLEDGWREATEQMEAEIAEARRRRAA